MKIKRIKKTKTTSLIVVEDQYWGILPNKVLHFFSIPLDSYTNLELQRSEDLKNEIQKYAWHKLLDYLAYRERSVFECRQYLSDKLFLLPEIKEKLIEKAQEMNYLNQERFAELYCEHLIQKAYSRKVIQNKLYEKRIEPDLIESILAKKYTKDVHKENLNLTLEKATRRYGIPDNRHVKEKIMNFMTRKGFSYYDVNEVLEEK